MKIKVNITGHPAHIEEALKKFAAQAEKEKGLKSPYRERGISRTCDNPLSQDYHSNFITEKEFKR